MNNRIREVRKRSALNQDDFAQKIGLTKNFISLLETGGRIPSDRTINDICREFNVNEKWLRTGKGEMFLPAIDDEMNYVSELLEDVDNPLYEIIKSIMKTYLELDEKQKEMVKSFAKNLKENIKESQD